MVRHIATEHLMEMLKPNPNLPENLRLIAVECESLARLAIHRCGDGPELTAGLRKLLEAKDCFVRQALVDSRQEK
jgi:hypothetical protein